VFSVQFEGEAQVRPEIKRYRYAEIVEMRGKPPTPELVLDWIRGRIFTHDPPIVPIHPDNGDTWCTHGNEELWEKIPHRRLYLEMLENLVKVGRVHCIRIRGVDLYSDPECFTDPECAALLERATREVDIENNFRSIWSRWMLPGRVVTVPAHWQDDHKPYLVDSRIDILLTPEQASDLMDILRNRFT
jgi:hypothetical protein